MKKFSKALQEEIFEKIEFFRDPSNHKALKVHKLGGGLRGSYSFSINHKIRVVFDYLPTKPQGVLLLVVGDHDVYNQ